MKPRIHEEHVLKSHLSGVESIPDIDIYSFIFERDNHGGYPPVPSPDRVAHIDGLTGERILFTELKARVNSLARSLRHAIGLREQDVVCFYSRNHIHYPTAIWGVLRLGAIPSPANPAYTVAELTHQIKDSKAKFLIAHSESLDIAIKAAATAGMLASNILVIGYSIDGYVGINDLIIHGKTAPPIDEIAFAPDEAGRRLALLCYSSGTSGLPKGVLMSHRNLIANICQGYEFSKHGPYFGTDRVAIGVLPFYHSITFLYGMHSIVHQTLVFGITLVIVPGFDAKLFLEYIKKYSITNLHVVPPMLLALTTQPQESFNFSHKILEVDSAAAPLSPSLIPKITKMFPTAQLRQAWGLTEASVCLTLAPPTGPTLHHSCGLVYPSVELVLVDPETLESIPPSGEGEVWARSPSIVMGYGDAKATRETFDVLGDGSGWMRTGDAATFEFEHGKHWIVIKDRLKELIKVSGYQVAPAELESVLLSHPLVMDAAVVGKPNEKTGELPWGFVVAKGGENLKKELLQWVEERVARYKRLAGITFVDKIEKTPSGKILRRVYRDNFKLEKQMKSRL